MTCRLTIPGRLPGLNEYIAAERSSRYQGNAMKQTEGRRVGLCIRQQLRGVRITRPVVMRYTWVEPDRRRDKDNISSFGRKVIQDALVRAGTLRGDGWAEIDGFSDVFQVDRDNPRIEVEIVEMEGIKHGKEQRTSDAHEPAKGAGEGGGAADHVSGHDAAGGGCGYYRAQRVLPLWTGAVAAVFRRVPEDLPGNRTPLP